jgi:hypothetical protein
LRIFLAIPKNPKSPPAEPKLPVRIAAGATKSWALT